MKCDSECEVQTVNGKRVHKTPGRFRANLGKRDGTVSLHAVYLAAWGDGMREDRSWDRGK